MTDTAALRNRLEDRSIPITECGCLIWLGGISDHGYGSISINGKMERTHRASWIAYNGPIPDGLHVLHKCDLPLCINPEHLFLGTHQDNMKDRSRKKRGNHPTGLRNGRHTQPYRTCRGENHPWHKNPNHARGENNWNAKLTEQQILEIRDWKESQASASRHFKISTTTINAIVKRKIWKHL